MKSLDHGNNENHQVENTKQLKETCGNNDNRTLRENVGGIKKGKTSQQFTLLSKKTPATNTTAGKRPIT